MALDLILAGNRLNDKTMICKLDSVVLFRMIRKIYLSTQTRTLCSYGDVITIIHDSDYHQICFRTYKRMSLSSDEFIEILGEIYHTSYDTIETMKYYLDANDIIDLDTNLIHSSVLTSKQIDDMIKYIVREDAIRQLLKLIFDRIRNNDSHIDDEHRQLKLNLPMKLNDLYQTIKELNAFSNEKNKNPNKISFFHFPDKMINTLDTLPNEMLFNIFSYLSWDEILISF
ncbi:unnamed protein product [Rotaria sp. Silwood1]|nr:unnamed protein product [Rotaria sp. Silwood1]